MSDPAASSRTANARHDAVIRQAGTLDRTFKTRPPFDTKTMSIGNFMKKVWMAFVGAMIKFCGLWLTVALWPSLGCFRFGFRSPSVETLAS